MASTDTQSNNSSSKNFVAQLPKSHKSTGSLNSMNSRDSIKQIDLEKELVKANAFTENILDVLMTLQFEVIDNRKMDSERLDKIISKFHVEIETIHNHIRTVYIHAESILRSTITVAVVSYFYSYKSSNVLRAEITVS